MICFSYLHVSGEYNTTSHNNLTKVISMSLYGNDERYTYGAVHNVQLAKLYYPGWIVRFYIEKPNLEGETLYSTVPIEILNKLETIGAQLIEIDLMKLKIGKCSMMAKLT